MRSVCSPEVRQHVVHGLLEELAVVRLDDDRRVDEVHRPSVATLRTSYIAIQNNEDKDKNAQMWQRK